MENNESNKYKEGGYVTRTYTSHQESAPVNSYSFETKREGGAIGGAGGEYNSFKTIGGNTGGYATSYTGGYQGLGATGIAGLGQTYTQQAYTQAVPVMGQGFIQGGYNATAPIILNDRRISSGGYVNAPLQYNFGEANRRASFVLEASPQIIYDRPERRSMILESNNVQIVQRQPQVIPVYRQIHYVQQPVVQQAVTVDNSAELEHLRLLLQSKSEECEQWRLKYESIELQFRTYQSQNRGSSQELESLRISYESRLSECISEIERLNGVLRVKLEEIERLRSSQTQIYEYESQIISYKNEIESLRYELENSLSSKRLKAEEAEEYRRKYMTFESTISELRYEITRLQNELSLREREVSDWRSKYSSIEIEIRTLEESSHMNQDYEMKVALLTQEIERLNVMLKNKNAKIESMQSEYSSLRSEISSREMTISELRSEITSIERSYSNYSSLEKKLMDYENRIALLSQEIERQTSMNSKKTYEIENLKRSSMMIDEKEVELSRMRASVEEWRTKYNSISYEISSRDSRVRDLEATISSLRIEIERLTLMSSNSSEIEIWRGKYSALCAQFVLICAEIECLRMGSLNTEASTNVVAVRSSIGGDSASYNYGGGSKTIVSEKVTRLSGGIAGATSSYGENLVSGGYGGQTVMNSERVNRRSGDNYSGGEMFGTVKRTSFHGTDGGLGATAYRSSVNYSSTGGAALISGGGLVSGGEYSSSRMSGDIGGFGTSSVKKVITTTSSKRMTQF